MIRKRLILSLLIKDTFFVNSRNFDLQAIIDLDALIQHLNFEAIDELIILNVSREKKDLDKFCEQIKEIAKNCFVPISAGGGIKIIEDFHKLLRSGADKIVINTVAIEMPGLITEAAECFGSQCIVVSIDVRKNKQGMYEVYSHNGEINTKKEVLEWAKEVEGLGAGEIFLTSIDRDGTCQGYDLGLIKKIAEAVTIPVIASGGVGEFEHLVEGITKGHALAVSLANLFHFVGHNLINAKKYLQSKDLGFPEPLWNF